MSIIIKTPEQIEGIRLSCKLSADTLKFIEPFVVPGVTTEELNQKCEAFIRDRGGIPAPLNYGAKKGESDGYPKAICASVNEVVCHGIPGERILKEGDIIGIDISTILNGYFGDTCYTYAVGKISPEKQRLLTVAKECMERGIVVCGPGKNFDDIAYAIHKYAKKNKYSVVHALVGHGVGLALHEAPNVHHTPNSARPPGPIMKPGMIFTIEPMVNAKSPEIITENDRWTVRTRDKSLSAQYEHTILITETGYEILT